MKKYLKQLNIIIEKLYPGLEFDSSIEIDFPTDEKFGDYTTNVAMKLSRNLKRNPIEVGQEIIEWLKKDEFFKNDFEKIELIKPGFINLYLKPGMLKQAVQDILERKEKYSKSNIGKGKKVQVEFISANPTGPLTLANGRGGFCGDVLANVLKKTGYDVQREYYVNDAGEQTKILGHSILGDDKAIYSGDYIDELKKEIDIKKNGNNPEKIGKDAAKIIMEKFVKPVIKDKMKIKFDRYFSELNDLREKKLPEKTKQMLEEKGLIYEEDGAVWMKTSKFDDDKDRVLIKSDGEATYFFIDVAYHLDKFKRNFVRVINLWGADHHGYVPRMQAAITAIGYAGKLDVVLMQMVRLIRNGKEVKMSKRSGVYVTMEELIDEVGLDVARFFFLMHDNNTHMDFNLDLAKEKSEKNPVYYVQYAYARISSVLSRSVDQSIGRSVDCYDHPAEISLIRELKKWPHILEGVSKSYEIHRLPFYARELANKFHNFYNHCRVIEGDVVNQNRLQLIKACRIILADVLQIMGISLVEKM